MIKTINYKPGKYSEKCMKIKFNSDDQLPLNKTYNNGKEMKIEYGRNRYHNMSEKNKQRFKEYYKKLS